MKKITIVAHSGIGSDRVKVGEKDVVMPSTFAEVKSGKFEGWDEERTMARAIASAKIEEQRGMRPSTGGLTDEEKAILAEFRAKKAKGKKAPKVRNRTRENREAAAAPATSAE